MIRLDLRAEARALAPSVPHLPALVDMAIATWRGRMQNEWRSHRVFEALSDQLKAAGFEGDDVAACRTFADEERAHGALCGAAVEALGGEATVDVPDSPPLPRHADCGGLAGALRNIISVCCMAETVAVALIGAERNEMPEGPLRDLLTRILGDEVGHSRFGWLVANARGPGLAPDARAAVDAYLPVAFAHLEAHELAHIPPDVRPPPSGRAYGLCRGDEARELFYATVDDVIVPGLEQAGFAAARAWRNRHRSGNAATVV